MVGESELEVLPTAQPGPHLVALAVGLKPCSKSALAKVALELVAAGPSDLHGYWIFTAGNARHSAFDAHVPFFSCTVQCREPQLQDYLSWSWLRGMWPRLEAVSSAAVAPCAHQQEELGILFLHVGCSSRVTLRSQPERDSSTLRASSWKIISVFR